MNTTELPPNAEGKKVERGKEPKPRFEFVSRETFLFAIRVLKILIELARLIQKVFDGA